MTRLGRGFPVQVRNVAAVAATVASPQTWTGGTGTVVVSGVDGSFIPDTSTWVGGTGTIVVSGVNGTFSSGDATWTGGVGTIVVSGVTGAFAASGTVTWTGGTGTIVVAGVAGSFSEPATTLYPVSRSGRKFLDQNGDVWLGCCMSSWGWTLNPSNANITTYLEALADLGFNTAVFSPCGQDYDAYGGSGWDRYTQDSTSQAFFTGTPLASSLGAAWASVDHFISEADRVGIHPVLSLYTGFNNDQGVGDDLVSVGTTNAYNYGAAIAARYAGVLNLSWHLGADSAFNYGSAGSVGRCIDAFFHGIRDGEVTAGDSPRLILFAEPDSSQTVYSQFINQQGTSGSGYQWLHVDSNGLYDYTYDVVDNIATPYGQIVRPLADVEPPYVNSPWPIPSPPTDQQLRERVWSDMISDVQLVNHGDEDIWSGGLDQGHGGGPTTWAPALAADINVQVGMAFDLLRTHVADATWVQSNFVTGGQGTTTAKASEGNSDSRALAYFPNSRGSITVNTTLLAGTGNVSLDWLDPTDGTLTSIATSEAQNASRSVTHPGNNTNDAGDSDWVLLVQLLEVTWTGGTGTIVVSGVSGSFAVSGTAVWAGGVGTVPVAGTSGTFTAGGTAVWAGGTGQVLVSGTTGSFVADGIAVWTGGVGTITVGGVTGVFVEDGAPQTWVGGTGVIDVLGVTGAFVPGASTWTGNVGTIVVAGTSGLFAADGAAAWAGGVGTVLVAGTSGVFTADGTGVWPGGVGTITVTGVDGTFGGVVHILPATGRLLIVPPEDRMATYTNTRPTVKDPDATLDYPLDVGEWLADGAELVSADVTIYLGDQETEPPDDEGHLAVVPGSVALSDGGGTTVRYILLRLTGGLVETEWYAVRYQFTASDDNQDQRTRWVRIRQH